MGYFQVRYDSRVVNYDRRGFIRLATDIGIKSVQIFQKVAQKVATAVLRNNGMFFEKAQKVTKYLGYFCNKIYCQEIPKISKSGHTGLTNYYRVNIYSIHLCYFHLPRRSKLHSTGQLRSHF